MDYLCACISGCADILLIYLAGWSSRTRQKENIPRAPKPGLWLKLYDWYIIILVSLLFLSFNQSSSTSKNKLEFCFLDGPVQIGLTEQNALEVPWRASTDGG
jgi:hypothetical protein